MTMPIFKNITIEGLSRIISILLILLFTISLYLLAYCFGFNLSALVLHDWAKTILSYIKNEIIVLIIASLILSFLIVIFLNKSIFLSRRLAGLFVTMNGVRFLDVSLGNDLLEGKGDTNYVPREKEEQEIRDFLYDNTHAVLLLHGVPGSGKSRLAFETIDKFKPRFKQVRRLDNDFAIDQITKLKQSLFRPYIFLIEDVQPNSDNFKTLTQHLKNTFLSCKIVVTAWQDTKQLTDSDQQIKELKIGDFTEEEAQEFSKLNPNLENIQHRLPLFMILNESDIKTYVDDKYDTLIVDLEDIYKKGLVPILLMDGLPHDEFHRLTNIDNLEPYHTLNLVRGQRIESFKPDLLAFYLANKIIGYYANWEELFIKLWGMNGIRMADLEFLAFTRLSSLQQLYHQLTNSITQDNIDKFNEHNIALSVCQGLFNAICDYGNAEKLGEMEGKLNILQAIASNHPDHTEIQLRLAKGLYNLTLAYCKIGELNEMENKLKDLQAIASKHPNHAEIQLELAKGLSTAIFAYGNAGKLAKTEDKLKDLQAIAQKHTNHVEIQLKLAQGLINAIASSLEAGNFETIDNKFKQIDKLWRKHIKHPEFHDLMKIALQNIVIGSNGAGQVKLRDQMVAYAKEIYPALLLHKPNFLE